MHATKIIALLDVEHAAIASIVAGTGLSYALEQVIVGAQAQFDDEMHACVLLLDANDRFTAPIAPALPQAYCDALRHAEIGPRTNPFGSAAFSGALAFSGDIAQDQAWTNGRKDALMHGYRACWAAPIFGAKGRILGVLGLLFHSHRHPTQMETDLLTIATRACAHTVERYLSEKALAENATHLRHTLELNAQVLWTACPDGQFDYIARRWRDWTGTSGLGGTWLDALHDDDRAATRTAWQQAVHTGAPYDGEHRLRMQGGQYRWCRTRASCRRDDDRNIVKWYGSTEDIHDYWEARAALQKSDAEFRMLSKAMPNQAWAAHADGAVYWCNQRVYEYSGARPGQLDGSGWLMLLHPDDVGAAQRAWNAAIASGQPYEVEFRLRRARDDTYRWFLSRALSVRDEQGGVTRWVGTNTDVQEQKNVAQKLSFLNESLEIEVANRTADRDRMWRLSTDLMLVADFTSLIIAVNPAWQHVLGRSEHETLGMDFMHLVHPEDRIATLAEVDKLQRGETVLHFENRYQHRDGSYRWISWTAVSGDELLHAIGRDVSETKRAREALAGSEMALRQAQKLESIGKLTGGVAHDFNNVLQIISGNLQLLHMVVGDNPQAVRRLETSADAVERGAKLSSQLLAFARRQPLKPLVTDLRQLLRSMDELLQRAIGEAVALELVVGAGLWNTMVDPNQLENVLLNMAINARDAMAGQGKLTIEVSNAVLDDAYGWRHADVEPGQYVMLAVSDTGHGMNQETVGKIFEPFFTTKKEGEGTGLGLSMAYGFVKQSGGHIKVDSEPGQGATFRLYLPRSLEMVADLPETLGGAVLGGSETILVVEDDPQVQATVVDILRDLGYAVLRANDALSALMVVRSGVPIDLLFTDVVMPGPLRSPELARQARQLLPSLEVLFTSGYTQDAIVHGGRLDAGVELLSKPYRREDLARKLRHLLGRRKPLNRLAAPMPAPPAPSMPAQALLPEPVQPVAIEPAAPEPAPLAAARPATPAGRHILLVEDNDDAREMTSELLNMLGHTVLAVGSAEEAQPLLETEGLQILMTDITLPGMSGIELVALARREQPQLGVIFCSGHDQRSLHDATAKFLLKPFSLAQLQGALQS